MKKTIAMKKAILLFLGLLLALGVLTNRANENPCPDGSWTYCDTPAWVELNPVSLPPTVDCAGKTFTLSTTINPHDGTTVTYTRRDCSWTIDFHSLGPTILSNWWVVGNDETGETLATGTGLTATFTPTNCGPLVISFNCLWTNSPPCNCDEGDCEEDPRGGVAGKSVTITNSLAITPDSTNALINRCRDPNRSVTFHLAPDSAPCGATWSIIPSGVPNGATISGSGSSATVRIGEVTGNYTIMAVWNISTNCVATANLSVTRDCVCTNHDLPDNPSGRWPPDAQSCDSSNWTGSVFTTSCLNTAQLTCTECGENLRCVTFRVNGQNVGHCPYLPSSWTANYFLCKCGDVIMQSYWDVSETDAHGGRQVGPCIGCGYSIESNCGVLGQPFCYNPDGSERQCTDGDW